ncbi:hypothetical protein [Desulfocastanea catecholica]
MSEGIALGDFAADCYLQVDQTGAFSSLFYRDLSNEMNKAEEKRVAGKR